MQIQQDYSAREVQKIDLSKILFAFAVLAFGTSLVSVLVATLMPTYNIFTTPAPYKYGTVSLSSEYITSTTGSWIFSVSAYVFLVFPAIGVFCSLLGVLFYKRDLLWRLAKDMDTYFKVLKYLERHEIASSNDHGQVFTDDANGLAMEIKVITNENDVRAVDDHIANDLNFNPKDRPSMLFVVNDENRSIEKPKLFCNKYNKEEETWQSRCIVIEH